MKPLALTAHTYLLVSTLAAIALLVPVHSVAQPDLPSRTMTIEHVRDIHFGTFYVTGSGGTVSVNFEGARTCQGGVVLMSSGTAAQSGAFTVRLCPGRNVALSYNPTVTLTSGSNTLTMTIDSIEGVTSNNIYTTSADCDFANLVRIGGTITVPANAPPGTYQGSFRITFNQN